MDLMSGKFLFRVVLEPAAHRGLTPEPIWTDGQADGSPKPSKQPERYEDSNENPDDDRDCFHWRLSQRTSEVPSLSRIVWTSHAPCFIQPASHTAQIKLPSAPTAEKTSAMMWPTSLPM